MVGVPVEPSVIIQEANRSVPKIACRNTMKKCLWDIDVWDVALPTTFEPQEIDILGSIRAPACVFFNYTWTWCWDNPRCPSTQDVSPENPVFRNASAWCDWTVLNRDGVTYYQAASDHTLRKLPRGVLLICGDCAWPAMPFHAVGGPCTIGHLIMLAPNLTRIANHTHATCSKPPLHSFASGCDDTLDF